MKKFLQSLPMATIVLLVFAMISFVWGSDQKRMAGVDSKAEIIDISGESNFSEHEGKYVFLIGAPKFTETPTDTKFNVKADGYVLVRTVEMYQYTLIDDAVYKDFSGLQHSDIKGKNGESHVNPSFPDDLKNAVFFGKTVVGENEVPINESYIEALRLKKSSVSDNIKLTDIDNLKLDGYKSCGDGYYTKADPNNWKIGDVRIKFSYLPADAVKEITVCGVMKNGTITNEDTGFSYISDSIKDPGEIITEIRGDHGSSANGLFIMGVIEIAGAVVVFIISKFRKKTV